MIVSQADDFIKKHRQELSSKLHIQLSNKEPIASIADHLDMSANKENNPEVKVTITVMKDQKVKEEVNEPVVAEEDPNQIKNKTLQKWLGLEQPLTIVIEETKDVMQEKEVEVEIVANQTRTIIFLIMDESII